MEEKDHEELHLELSKAHAFFICSQRLGMLEGQIASLAATPGKRKRAIEFNRIVQALKYLKAIPQNCRIVSLGYGVLDTGDAGLIALCVPPTQIQGQVPNGSEVKQQPEGKPDA